MVDKTFHLGLTMAGAISAGAYTAGVFDFLMEALEAWEAEKRKLRAADPTQAEAEWRIPSHNVVIPVMSGASAGSITGALGLVALAEAPPANGSTTIYSYPQVGKVISTLPRLYQAWVEMPCFVSENQGPDLLGTTDLDPLAQPLGPDGKVPATVPVNAALDVTLLGKIVERSLLGITQIGPARPYLAEDLHLFLTHTNLRGVPYRIGFTAAAGGAPQGYDMLCHADRVHYLMRGIGNAAFNSPWATPDPARPLHVATLPALAKIEGEWGGFATAALATGAFPVGLQARAVDDTTYQEYTTRQWPLASLHPPANTPAQFTLTPSFPPMSAPDQAACYAAVDGGVIDNEPFQLARWTLMKTPGVRNEPNASLVDRAVVMIDPFPEPPDYDLDDKPRIDLGTVVKRLFPALKDQARFKPDDLAAALDDDINSRFLISPRRRVAPGAALEPYGIACGLLGGFGGFLSEEFRAHDYQLGRLNCYLFLRDTFALPLTNGVLAQGYKSVPTGSFQGTPTAAGIATCQIIPLLGSAATMPEPPVWPRVTTDEVDRLIGRARHRVEVVAKSLVVASTSSRLLRGALRIFWPLLETRFGSFLRSTILKELWLRDQIAPPAGVPNTDVHRKVMAALADPAYDQRTVGGIARQYKLTPAEIVAAIGERRAEIWPGDWRPDQPCTLRERAPGWIRSLPVFRQLYQSLISAPPVID